MAVYIQHTPSKYAPEYKQQTKGISNQLLGYTHKKRPEYSPLFSCEYCNVLLYCLARPGYDADLGTISIAWVWEGVSGCHTELISVDHSGHRVWRLLRPLETPSVEKE